MEVDINQVSGHVRVKDNEQADKAEKVAAGSIGIRKDTERFTSLAHINRTITEIK